MRCAQKIHGKGRGRAECGSAEASEGRVAGSLLKADEAVRRILSELLQFVA
jgi:hypothetical protein